MAALGDHPDQASGVALVDPLPRLAVVVLGDRHRASEVELAALLPKLVEVVLGDRRHRASEVEPADLVRAPIR